MLRRESTMPKEMVQIVLEYLTHRVTSIESHDEYSNLRGFVVEIYGAGHLTFEVVVNYSNIRHESSNTEQCIGGVINAICLHDLVCSDNATWCSVSISTTKGTIALTFVKESKKRTVALTYPGHREYTTI